MPFTLKYFRTESEDGRNFRLLEGVPYYTAVRGKLEKVFLPVGSTSDGASTPEAVWSIPGFQPFGLVWKPAWVHDGGYRGTWETEGEPWTRQDVDKLLLEAMENAGIDKLHREAIYEAVRKFGQPAWDAGHAPKA